MFKKGLTIISLLIIPVYAGAQEQDIDYTHSVDNYQSVHPTAVAACADAIFDPIVFYCNDGTTVSLQYINDHVHPDSYCAITEVSYSCNTDTLGDETSRRDTGYAKIREFVETKCEPQAGQATFYSTSSAIASSIPSPPQCVDGCTVTTTESYCIGGVCQAEGEFTGAACDIDSNTQYPVSENDRSTEPPTETTTNSDGTTEPPTEVPGEPPETAAPAETSEVSAPSGSFTTETYASESESSTIVVVTDSTSGELISTTVIPNGGDTNYLLGGSGSTTGTTDVGTTDGGTTGATTEGDGTTDGDTGSASGGLACDFAPTCSGKAIECAVLYQSWEDRCNTEAIEEELLSETSEGDITDSAQSGQVEGLIDGIGDSIGDVDGAQATGIADAARLDPNALENLISGPAGCNPAMFDLNMMGANISGAHFCSVYEPLKGPAGYALYMLAILAIYQMWFGAYMRTQM